MATYEEAGVNIDLGDRCSKIAYQAAMNTFKGREGMIGGAVKDEGGFSGMLDFGEFYLVQNDDGVGTKIQIAEAIGQYDTLGYDLLAMVVDDAVCVGAEPISVSNTLDVDQVNETKIAALMVGLEKACLEHKVVIPGGEIAELGKAVNGYLWNATVVGILGKEKLINGANIQSGDKIIGLKSAGFRSNGFSLVRHVLRENLGEDWANQPYGDGRSWGEVTLIPSKIYSSLIMELHGRYGQPSTAEIKGVVHVTGGGIQGNLDRLMKKTSFKADLHTLPEPHEPMRKLMEMGNISKEEAYKTWNMGLGMLLVSNDVDTIIAAAERHGVEAMVIGEVI